MGLVKCLQIKLESYRAYAQYDVDSRRQREEKKYCSVDSQNLRKAIELC